MALVRLFPATLTLHCRHALNLVLNLVRAAVLLSVVVGSVTAQNVELLKNIQQANIRIIEKAEPAVVSIARVKKGLEVRGGVASGLRGFNFNTDDVAADAAFIPSDFGAGVIVRTKNPRHPLLILTNYHVVRGGPVFGKNADNAGSDLWVTIANRPRFKSSIVAADPHSDLAVITLSDQRLAENPPALVPTVTQPKKGQFVFALGNPYTIAKDGSASVSWGIVSNVMRSPFTNRPDFENEFRLFDNLHHFGTLVQIGVALPLGTSGGALLDLDGNLIGITTSLAPMRGYEQSAGYAIPFTSGFVRVLDRLMQGYEVGYGFLGVRPADATVEDFDGLPADKRPSGGAVALSITANSPALRGGLEPNDVVVAVESVAVRSNLDLMREIALIGPNKDARLKIWRPRDKQFVTKTVALGKWPVQNDADIVATATEFPDWRGIRVDYSTARAKNLRGGGAIDFESGVLVLSVDESRHGLKLQAGDFVVRVGDRAVNTPAEFRAAVKEFDGKPVTLRTADEKAVRIDK